jgi:hypothetical protein
MEESLLFSLENRMAGHSGRQDRLIFGIIFVVRKGVLGRLKTDGRELRLIHPSETCFFSSLSFAEKC